MARAFLFPGQGSQAVGMGLELAEAFPAARYLFQEVDEALGQSLSQLMFEGPEEQLVLTENAQPALMAVSLAVARVLEEQRGVTLADQAAFVAGHSLGEYSALAAAGALSVEAAAELLKARGQAMQAAVPVGEGAMAALIGLDLATVRDIAGQAAEGEVCEPANDNAPGQVVVSGHKTAVKRAVALAREGGARRALMLPVSAPFHCALMRPAAEAMAERLADVELTTPRPPLVANVSATVVEDPEAIRRGLVDQVTSMVRWRESVEYMRDRSVDSVVELGSGTVLSGLARRIEPSLQATAIGGPGDLEAFLDAL